MSRLCAAGFLCPVVTVQSRIAKGLFSLADFHAWFVEFAAGLSREGAHVTGPYVCPHRYADPCACKKPQTLLYEQAAVELGIDLRRAFVIGDTAADMEAAFRSGGQGCLVRTGWGADSREVERAVPYTVHAADAVGDAVTWIVTDGSQRIRSS